METGISPSHSVAYSSLSLRDGNIRSRYGTDSTHSSNVHEIGSRQGVTLIATTAVTRTQRWRIAVHLRWSFSSHPSAIFPRLLRQKPTSIDRGVTVGTNELNRQPPTGGSFSSTREGIEVTSKTSLQR